MRKCALVTGGSRGIGRAIAIQLAKDHSYHIIVNYSSNETAVNETVEIITEAGGSAETLQFKVQNYAEVLGKLSTWKDNNPEDSIFPFIEQFNATPPARQSRSEPANAFNLSS